MMWKACKGINNTNAHKQKYRQENGLIRQVLHAETKWELLVLNPCKAESQREDRQADGGHTGK